MSRRAADPIKAAMPFCYYRFAKGAAHVFPDVLKGMEDRVVLDVKNRYKNLK